MLDTAGRTTLTKRLMGEAAESKTVANPACDVLLVRKLLTGQGAVNWRASFERSASAFYRHRAEAGGRCDGRRRERRLSICARHGKRRKKPIKVIGTGEKTDAWKDFHPSRMDGRILGLGDVGCRWWRGLPRISMRKSRAVAEKMRKGRSTFRPARAIAADGEIWRHSENDGHEPGCEMKNQIAKAGLDDRILKRRSR